jgi:plasmid stability protein
MNLPDSLLEAARARAEREGRTVTSLVEEALRDLLARSPVTPETRALPTDGHPEGRFLIDIDDAEALATALDEDGFR